MTFPMHQLNSQCSKRGVLSFFFDWNNNSGGQILNAQKKYKAHVIHTHKPIHFSLRSESKN